VKIAFVDNLLLGKVDSGYRLQLQPHLGLISLIAVLRTHGHEAILLDPKLDLYDRRTFLGPNFYQDVAERILAHKPDIVGFTSLGCNFVCTVRIAQEVRRRRREIPIMLGGPHASILDREILDRYPQFDAIARNEAEGTICDIVDAFGGRIGLADVRGLSFRGGGEIHRTPDAEMLLDLDALPFAAYDAFPIGKLNLNGLDVDAGRGCPFHCTFCSTASFFGRRYRTKSGARLVAELDRLFAEYGVRHFSLAHDLFTVNKQKVREFCAAVSTRGYTWSCSARMDCVDDALLKEMREAGCTAIYYGVETGSQRLQKIIGKNLDLKLYYPRIESSTRLGMKVTASFITGYPNESLDDQNATLELIGSTIARYPRDIELQLHLLTPEPGTELHHEYRDFLAHDGHVTDFNFPALEPDDRSVIASDSTAFVCHHYYDCGVARARNIDITEAFRTLYCLGHELLDIMSEPYGGSFSRMLSDFAALSRSCDKAPLGAILDFVRSKWGSDHPFVDVISYLIAVSELRSDRRPRLASIDGDESIRLAACIVPMDSGRDGAEVLQRIRNGTSYSPPAEVSWRLMFANSDLSSYRTFPIDSLTYQVATALQRGTSVGKLEESFSRRDLTSRMRSLCLMGAVVADTAECVPQSRLIAVPMQRPPTRP
jgi:radical SAM superfamily enzyme YgiQ (UPF0313 family)